MATAFTDHGDAPASLAALQSEVVRLTERVEAFAVTNTDLTVRNRALVDENQLLARQVRQLKHKVWGRSSERSITPVVGVLAFDFWPALDLGVEPTGATTDTGVLGREGVGESTRLSASVGRRATASTAARRAKGPKPLDPQLPREVLQVPDPDTLDLICPVLCTPREPGFTEVLEVLARKPAAYYVKRYERTVFVSPAKTAPVATPWPADVLSKSRMHASVVAYLATAHYADHLPFYRIEKSLQRAGIHLPRSTQVSLIAKLDTALQPVIDQIKKSVFQSGYLQVDATPVDLLDPARPRGTREACLWSYRTASDTPALVWFDYQTSKSPRGPDTMLKTMQYRGLVQTDAASGLDKIGLPDQITHVGCWAHYPE